MAKPKTQTRTPAKRKSAEEDDKPQTRAQAPAQLVKDLRKERRDVRADNRELSGGYGGRVKAAVDNSNLHRKAFAAACGADDILDPAKIADFLECRDYYERIFGLRERAAKAPRLPMGEDLKDNDKGAHGRAQNGGEPAPGNGAGGTNVKPFPAPASVPG